MTPDPSTSLYDDMDYTSDMTEDKKRWLCVPRSEKKFTKYKTKKNQCKQDNVIVFYLK